MDGSTSDSGLADEFDVVEQLSEAHVVELHGLVKQQWWGGKRTLQEVESMIQNTSRMIGLVERSSGQLVGFCRALTDFVFRP